MTDRLADDMRCEQCQGIGTHHDGSGETVMECRMCDGTGRVCSHHTRGAFTGINHAHLTVVHGWLSTYVRCWYCDLRIRVGWRWNFRSVGHALNYAESKGLI